MSGQHEHAFATPADLGGLDRYRAWCRAAGLPPVEGGYGLLMVNDTFTGRVTRLTHDVEYVRTLAAAATTGSGVGGVQIPPGIFPYVREGWPDEWV
ncbi:hypothetical protein ACWDR0_23905 [Streptomyces sp. NPDC003691]